MRKILTIATLALIHFIAYLFCFSREFDTAPLFPFKWHADAGYATWSFLRQALEFPIGTLADSIGSLPEFLGVPILAINSLLWGTVAYYIFSKLLRRRLTALSF